MANRYLDLDTFRAEQALLSRERDDALDQVEQHWRLLRTPATRGVLLRDAIGDAVGNWKPIKVVREVLNGRVSGTVLGTVGAVYAASRSTWIKRLVYGGMNWAMGALFEKKQGSRSGLHALARVVGSVLKKT